MSKRYIGSRRDQIGLRNVVATLLAAFVSTTACVGIVGDTGDEANGKTLVLAPAALPRLTAEQYRSTLVELFGNAAPSGPLEDDTKPYLFYNIGASTTTLSELGVQLYEESADALSRYVFADAARRAAFVGCTPAAPGDACVESFLRKFGRRVVRRPLTEDEVARWVNVSKTLADPDAWEGLRLAVAGLIQSPHFLYRVDLGSAGESASRRKLDGYELASRLSFLLWNQGPDEALLDAAESGELDTREGVAMAAERLLDDPRARGAVQAFFRQYLDLGRLAGINRNPATYPLFAPGITDAMRREVELIVDDLVFETRGDARSIFSTRMTYVNTDLAALYGVDAPGATKTEFVEVELPADGPRAGILTFGAFLTMNAHESYTSPTARGKYVRERVLCLEVPAPPPGVDTSLDPVPMGEPPKTVRERMELHRTNPSCASCHSFMDPPGFLFEHFDSSGAYRTVQEGVLPIDSSGDLDGTPLTDARGLATILETDPRVGRCMVRQLYRHAQGRLETPGEALALEDLADRFAAASFDFRSLLIELVTHDAFRFVGTKETP
ncbi:MAG: DUF1592 domain-containing protein [Polyangiaceae bacterium]|nr:DUF1592 domain-containing protein [Polyangiaceae bacterium]